MPASVGAGIQGKLPPTVYIHRAKETTLIATLFHSGRPAIAVLFARTSTTRRTQTEPKPGQEIRRWFFERHKHRDNLGWHQEDESRDIGLVRLIDLGVCLGARDLSRFQRGRS